MNKTLKIILSIILGLSAFVCLGLWPYIPGPGVLISMFLFAIFIIAIFALWRKKQTIDEGEVFKYEQKDGTINNERYDYTTSDINKINEIKNKINELKNSGVLTDAEAAEKLFQIDRKLEEEQKTKNEVERKQKIKSSLNSLRDDGILTQTEYDIKLKELFPPKETESNNQEETDETTVYQCVHCNYTQVVNFEYCPQCHKDDNGLTENEKINSLKLKPNINLEIILDRLNKKLSSHISVKINSNPLFNNTKWIEVRKNEFVGVKIFYKNNGIYLDTFIPNYLAKSLFGGIISGIFHHSSRKDFKRKIENFIITEFYEK
jgi:cell fate (sporulation/competence/biofilm development) regulator YlbF (YheA/YmcA/DUF963 family)